MIDLIVSLMIMAIIAGIAFPAGANSLAGYQARAAAQRLAADLQFAQDNARASGTSELISFDANANSYSLTNARPDGSSAAYEVKVDAAPFHCEIQSVDFDGDDFLKLDAYGFPHSGGSIIIGNESATHKVHVAAGSGAVTGERQ